MMKGEGARGLQSIHYSVKLWKLFNISYDMDDKKLKCVGKLAKTSNSIGTEGQMYVEKSAVLNITLSECKYRPT